MFTFINPKNELDKNNGEAGLADHPPPACLKVTKPLKVGNPLEYGWHEYTNYPDASLKNPFIRPICQFVLFVSPSL
jgi:hypothetical protein